MVTEMVKMHLIKKAKLQVLKIQVPIKERRRQVD